MARPIQGAILDVDGTLVNSNDAHARAWVDTLAASDIQVAFNDVRRLIGMGSDKLLPAIANVDSKSALGRRLAERRAEIFRTRYLPQLRAFPRARDLVSRLRNQGLKVTVASSARQEELSALLDIAGVADLIEHSTSSSDVESSKPDPDIVQAALAGLELSSERVLMLGDTPYDVEAAARAGIRTIALRSGGRSDADLEGAIAIYDDCADLLERFASSPFAASRLGDADGAADHGEPVR